jgi:transcriptional regulator with XRE-family HTH domain
MEREVLMKAITGCYDALRVQRGWGIAEVAKELGVHYETARRLRAGEIKEPSFALVAELHRLANRSLDQWIGIASQPLGPDAALAEKRIRELIVDQLGILLARGLTGQPGNLPLKLADGIASDDGLVAVQTGVSDTWGFQAPNGQMEDALLHAGKTLMQAGDSLLRAGRAFDDGKVETQQPGRSKRQSGVSGH